jgi:simple sugar transport system ATP-binding protein
MFMKNAHTKYIPQSPFNVDFRAMQKATERLVSEYSISTPSTKTQARFLSGGIFKTRTRERDVNKPTVFIAEHPT